MKSYPYWRVGIGFVLFPAVAGVLFGFIFSINAILEHGMEGVLFNLTMAPFAVTLFSIVAIAVEIIPSAVLSIICLIFKPQRTWYNYVLVVFAGGVGVALWDYFFS